MKPLFDEAWDHFQINMVKIGGNKRFFEFLKEYGKERDTIDKKYTCTPAVYYRKKLTAQAADKQFTEPVPAKSAQEYVTKSIDKTGKFFGEVDSKYEISRHTSEAATTAKVGIMSLWGRAKTLVQKNPNPTEVEQTQASAAQATTTATETTTPAAAEESKEPQS